MDISADFDRCCRDFEAYPHSLILQDLDINTYAKCEDILSHDLQRLLIKDNENSNTNPGSESALIRCRDIHTNNLGADPAPTAVLQSDAQLKTWLGDTTQLPSSNGSTLVGEVATRSDPQCRIVYLTAKNNRAALKVTRKSLLRLFTYHQVMPVYLELLSKLFGKTQNERNVPYFCFRDRCSSAPISQAHQMPSLGRSGRQFELAYSLKRIASSSQSTEALEKQTWSVRPAAFYHRFDIDNGRSVWIATHGQPDLYTQIECLTDRTRLARAGRALKGVGDNLQLAFEMHMLHATWALQGWDQYISWFEARVKNETFLAVHEDRSSPEGRPYTIKRLQTVQILKEKLNDAITVLEGNAHMLQSLRASYTNISSECFSQQSPSCKRSIASFCRSLENIEGDFRIVLAHARYQSQLAGERKGLVGLLSTCSTSATWSVGTAASLPKANGYMTRLVKQLLQYLQDDNICRAEALALDTRDITIDAQHEAVVVRIITVVTLCYLPATFVSTFFSTDVIKYQDAVSFSNAAMFAWLYVSLPLTFLTLVIAGYFFYDSYKRAAIKKSLVKRAVLQQEK